MKATRPYTVSSEADVKQFATLDAAMLHVARMLAADRKLVVVTHPHMASIVVTVQRGPS